MATNWNVKDAVNAISNGDKEAIQDIGRRFPNFLYVVAKGDFNALANAIPEHITARKIEAVLKGDVETSDNETEVENEVEEDAKEKEEPKKRAKKAKKEVEKDPVALYKECKKAGLKVKARQSAEYYEAELAKAAKANDEDDWGDEEADEKPAPAPKKKRAAKKQPEPVVEDDDEDDWDI